MPSELIIALINTGIDTILVIIVKIPFISLSLLFFIFHLHFNLIDELHFISTDTVKFVNDSLSCYHQLAQHIRHLERLMRI